MTVEQLIKRLSEMPPDATVTISNDDTFFSGEYEVTSIETYDTSTVEICTDYKHKLWEEDDEEEDDE